jgi:hypothetical protein
MACSTVHADAQDINFRSLPRLLGAMAVAASETGAAPGSIWSRRSSPTATSPRRSATVQTVSARLRCTRPARHYRLGQYLHDRERRTTTDRDELARLRAVWRGFAGGISEHPDASIEIGVVWAER